MAAATPSSQNAEPNQAESNKGKIVLKIAEELQLEHLDDETWWRLKTCDDHQFYKLSSGRELWRFVESEPVSVCGAQWHIEGRIRNDSGLFMYTENSSNFSVDCVMHTLELSLKCVGIPADKEFDVLGVMYVRTKSQQEKNADTKSFNFARTITAAKNRIEDLMKIDVFKELKLENAEDGIVVEVAFTVEQREVNKSTNGDLAMLKVNETYVEVNKFLLASKSEYFKSLFFGDRFPETKHEVQLPPSTTVEDFRALLGILEKKSKWHDGSIQGTFILANFFGFPKLEAIGRQLLVESCGLSIVCKYKLAETCGLTHLRDHILANFTPEDISRETSTSMQELRQLDETAVDARLKELKLMVENIAAPRWNVHNYNFAHICGFTQLRNFTRIDVERFDEAWMFVEVCKFTLDKDAFAPVEARLKELNILDENGELRD